MIALALIVGVIVLIALANGNGALADNGSSLDLHGGFDGGVNLDSPDLSYIEAPAPETVTPATVIDAELSPQTYMSDFEEKERLRLEARARQIAPTHEPPPVLEIHKEDIPVESVFTHHLWAPGGRTRRMWGGFSERQ